MNHETPAAAHLLKGSTAKTFAEVCAQVEDACRVHQFGVIGSVDLKAKMNAKGVVFERNCIVFEVCNPHIAQGVLALNMDVASALPCRLAIYTENNQTVVSTLRPTLLLGLYDVPEGLEHAEQVERTMEAIIEKLTR